MRARDRKGYFISFEKTAEGLGGTTQAKLLVANLRKAGYDAIYTQNPYIFSDLLKSQRPPEKEWSHATELFLWMADRAQQYKEVIKPALMDGKVVVSDRYFDSTLAYQGCGRGWKTGFLLRLHQAATGALLPDLTFVIDGMTYRTTPNQDRYETLGKGFFQKVRNGLLRLAESDPRYSLIHPNGFSIDETAYGLLTVAKTRMEIAGKRPTLL